MTISNHARDRVKHAFEPIALAMGRAGLTPDALTLIGFAITVVGAALLTQQLWLAGGVVVLIGGVFDMFDGTLARATGRVSNLGAFMDSVFDRWGEAIVYLGIMWGALGAIGVGPAAFLAAAAMGSAFMVSYTRAKAEGLGFSTGAGMAAVGLAPREVRLMILSLGLILTGVTALGDASFGPADTWVEVLGSYILLDAGFAWLNIALATITIFATITVIQRILHVRAQAKRQAASIPSQTPSAR
jgi:phosphatidylglycerophosphate synthase